MNKKILFCATVDYHFKAFHLPIMKWFKDQGWEVHVAASGNINLPYTDKKFDIPIQRSPLNLKNRTAYKQLKQVMNENHYRIVHCHTPMGGVLGRLAARGTRKYGTKVVYTAHGFHFCKGSSLFNWLLYYPIERGLSFFTDTLITINNEDFTRATQHHFNAKQIEHVHGVGIDINRFRPIDDDDKQAQRASYGYTSDQFLLFYAAEFNKNKNQQLLIHALAKIKTQAPNVKMLLAGEGPLLTECRKLANELGVAKHIDFLGFRKDIGAILPMCDVAVASSLREGLPVNIMEAMASGLPVIATENRGHNALIENNRNGWTIKSGSNASKEMAEKMLELAKNKNQCLKLGIAGRKKCENTYAIQVVTQELSMIYSQHMKGVDEKEWKVQ